MLTGKASATWPSIPFVVVAMNKEFIICIIIMITVFSIGDDVRRTNVLLEQISKDIRGRKKDV